ncbi:hypothetical protein EYR38_003384 [Pleurotus pulmonarius]|nr:hypothetical protein EYR38_003384 [Pleurotus pulmonarius]
MCLLDSIWISGNFRSLYTWFQTVQLCVILLMEVFTRRFGRGVGQDTSLKAIIIGLTALSTTSSRFSHYVKHNHFVILRKILAILSLGLGLEIDTLWKIHHRGNVLDKGVLTSAPTDHVEWQHTKDHLRYAMYHPPTEEDRIKKKQLWVPGHTDLYVVTPKIFFAKFHYSQPIAGLQVLTAPDEWKYVRHYPDHIIVDLGDSIEFLTGGILKASPHRVIEPPEDQRHLDRLGIFYFVPFLPDTILKPIDHPSIRKLGSNDVFEEYYALGGKPITAEEWLVERSKLVGKKRTKREKREPRDILEEIHFRYNPSS